MSELSTPVPPRARADAIAYTDARATDAPAPAPPIPRSFFAYLRSFGPGLVIALTWLGASDLVNAAVAGANYGYALMWVLVGATAARFMFVNIIAKFELCNERGETLMAGLLRIHRSVPMLILALTLLLGHLFGAFLIRGIGDTSHKLAQGIGQPWMWSVAWVGAISVLVYLGRFKTVEHIFYVFLALLSIVFIGIALWVGPSPTGILKGVFLFQVPTGAGAGDGFQPVLILVSLIGALAGSVPNLLYPYFIRQKGWVGPEYRRVQSYDLLFGVLVLIALDLSVWVVAAEVLHPQGVQIRDMEDLAKLFVRVLGSPGAPLFYAGVLATLATSIIGVAVGFAYMSQDIMKKLTQGPQASTPSAQVKNTRSYRLVAAWCLLTPLVWSMPSMPGFVQLTVVVNAASVLAMPLVAGILWYLTANPRLIGERYKNRLWENLIMGVLFLLSLYATWQSIVSLL